MAQKKVCRQYSTDYLKFGFITSPANLQLPMCLTCEKTFSNEAMKPSRLLEHQKKIHPHMLDKDLAYYSDLKEKYAKRTTVGELFKKQSSNVDKGLITSYQISLLIARCGKQHTIGETLILPAIKVFINTMMGSNSSDLTPSVPLSNNTVSRRIDEMAEDIEEKLCKDLRKAEFVLQIDESTLCDNEAMLLAYVRYTDSESHAVEAFLFARSLITDTKGSSIFKVVEDYLNEKQIPMKNILACATDGAPAMVGRQSGFLAHLKKVVPNVFTVHCVIHRHHLVAKHLSDKLNKSLSIVVRAVNKIKAHSLNDRLFRELCHGNEEHFERLLLHTEVRWLSKGNCLRRFTDLYKTIIEFLNSHDTKLCEEVQSIESDLSYLTDIFEKLNEMTMKLQGNKINMVKAKGIISAFISKLKQFKVNIARNELYQFPSVKNLQESGKVTDADLAMYCSHLDAVKKDMEKRFHDLIELHIPCWSIDPFAADVQDIQRDLIEEITDLQHDYESITLFKVHGYAAFWPMVKNTYPNLWKEVKLLMLAFPTTYLVEKGFSAVVQLQTKQRNRLQISKKGDLRLYLTDKNPNIAGLVQKHQAQGSH